MQTLASLDPIEHPSAKRTWRLLVVDDCREDREAYRRYLLTDRARHYQIWEAESAEEALQLCRDRHWDLVLLDLQLPDMDGLELWEQLKQANTGIRPPATILLTAFGDEATAVRALKGGISDYLVKQQLEPSTLRLAVRAAIEQSCLEARLQQVRRQRQFIAGLALRVCQGADLQETLAKTVAEICELLACDRVAVFQADMKTGDSTLLCQTEGSSLSAIGSQQPEAPTVRGGGGATLGGISTSGFSRQQRAYLQQFTHATAWVLPIAWEETNAPGARVRLWGVLVVCRAVGEWQPDEVELLEELATQLAIATRHAEMLARLETALARERELNTVKSQIVTTVSHEYRTPLAAILAAATTLKTHERRLHGDMQRHLLSTIEKKAKHLGNLVEDMLMVERHNGERPQLQLEPIEPEEFFRTLLAEANLASQFECDRIVPHYAGDLKNFWTDRKLLTQALTNLLSNALKYSTNDSTVTLQVTGTETQLTFEVRDRGIGIPADYLPQLFQSFARGSNVGTIPGTGLGLFIVKTHVNLLGGKIEIDSEDSVGTTAIVRLPKQYSDIEHR
ncbi:MAG: ATP-binding protein [Cyanobacteria bacterium J06641_5]